MPLMKSKNNRSIFWKLAVLFPLLIITLLIIDVSYGSVKIPFMQIPTILFTDNAENPIWENIIWDFRMPKAITAVLVGAALAVSGLLMQTLFNNPLAGPFVLGITSGASLGVAVLVMAGYLFSSFLSISGHISTWATVLAACLGAGLVLFVVLLVSFRVRSSMTLLIIGLLFGSTTGALVSILQFFSDKEEIQTYLIWTFGSLGGITWNELQIFIPVVIVGLIAAFLLKKPLNALLLGEEYAQSMGVNARQVRIAIIAVTSILAGATTAFCGPIAFIGIAVPHLARLALNTGSHKYLVVGSAMLGTIVMLICDFLSQLPGSQFILPINAVTSLFGAPMVIWIILSRKDFKNAFV